MRAPHQMIIFGKTKRAENLWYYSAFDNSGSFHGKTLKFHKWLQRLELSRIVFKYSLSSNQDFRCISWQKLNFCDLHVEFPIIHLFAQIKVINKYQTFIGPISNDQAKTLLVFTKVHARDVSFENYRFAFDVCCLFFYVFIFRNLISGTNCLTLVELKLALLEIVKVDLEVILFVLFKLPMFDSHR